MKQNKIKNLLLTIFALFLGVPVFAQIGIGTDNPQGILDVKDTMGIVLPRVAKAEDVKTPDGEEAVIGTLVFDLSKNCARVKNSQGWSGCLLDSSGVDKTTFGYLGLGANFTAIKASVSNSWAILLGQGDHAVWFSGSNNYSQAGLGRAGGGVRSYTLVFTEPMVDIAAGLNHAIAADSLGRVWTWGSNANFATGQTGVTGTAITGGRTFLPDTVNFFGPYSSPKRLGTLVAASIASSFVVDQDGKLYSASTNAYEAGKAGSTAATWGQVTGIPASEKVVQISASLGDGTTVGSSTVGVVTDAGNVYVWGEGGNNGLGQNAGTDRNTPQQRTFNEKIYKVAMGYAGGAAITQDRKKLYGWGNAATLTNAANLTTPTDITYKIQNFNAARGDSIIDVSLARGSGGGGNITVIATVNGVRGVYVGGENSNGQLGVGNSTDQLATGAASTSPSTYLRPISTQKIADGTTFTSAASGGYNTILITGVNEANPSLSYVALGAGRASTSNSNRVLGAITVRAVYFTPLTK